LDQRRIKIERANIDHFTIGGGGIGIYYEGGDWGTESCSVRTFGKKEEGKKRWALILR